MERLETVLWQLWNSSPNIEFLIFAFTVITRGDLSTLYLSHVWPYGFTPETSIKSRPTVVLKTNR